MDGFEPRVGEAVTMRVPFEPSSAGVVRDELRAWLAQQGTDERTVEDARLVVSELVGNALRHATPVEQGIVLVGWRADEGRLSFQVSDGGAETLPQQRVADPQATDGRGLQIVSALADRWWVDSAPDGTTVHAEIPLPRAGSLVS